MRTLYVFFLHVYALGIRVVSLWNSKAKNWVLGRKNWRYNLKNALSGKENIYWFHCASLGEFEQARPLIEKLKKEKPKIPVLVSFFSPSGYEQIKSYELADYVCYLPLDTKFNAINFITSINIGKAFFVKYEVWPNYFTQLKAANIPFYLISATFREGQFYFKSAGKFFKKLLELPTHIFVQNEESKKLLEMNKINSLLAGDTRFDRVIEASKKAIPNTIVKQFSEGKFTLIAGSSWEKEEEIVCEVFFSLNQSFNVVFAPHDISENHIKGIVNLLKNKTNVIRYSEVTEETDLREYSILILDNIGLLSNVYQYGSAAIVGGGFTNSLHNILEPATFGLPVFYGDNYAKFPEGKEMKNKGGGISINGAEEFKDKLVSLIKNPIELEWFREKNNAFINDRIGATSFIYRKTEEG